MLQPELGRFRTQLGGLAERVDGLLQVVGFPMDDPDIVIGFSVRRILRSGEFEFRQSELLAARAVCKDRSKSKMCLGEIGPEAEGVAQRRLSASRVPPEPQRDTEVIKDLGISWLGFQCSLKFGNRFPRFIVVKVIFPEAHVLIELGLIDLSAEEEEEYRESGKINE